MDFKISNLVLPAIASMSHSSNLIPPDASCSCGDAKESWIGLDKLHSLTSSANYGLKVATLHSLIY